MPPDGILVVAKKIAQLQRLLDLLEKGLDCPSTFVKVGDARRCPIEIIGNERHLALLAVHLDDCANQPERIRIATSCIYSGQYNHVVAKDVALSRSYVPLFHAIHHVVLRTCHPKHTASCQVVQVLEIVRKLTDALAYAHDQKILHRDLKLNNVIMRDDEEPVLIDFGLAKVIGGDDTNLTRTGEIIGSPAYMAPERIFDSTLVDERSDQYSLGATLYALLTGTPPYEAIGVGDMIAKIRSSEPKVPAEFQMGIDERFADVVMRMLKKTPEGRYPTPTMMLSDLKRVGELGGIDADTNQWKS